MRGIKPFKLSFVTRPFQWGAKHHLGVGVLAYGSLSGDEVFTDMEMWKDAAEVMDGEPVLDVGLPKSRAEFLVAGSIHQPGGRPGPTRQALVRVGAVEKTVYAIGDRVWERGVPSQPEPFVTMPISWVHAFGGEGFDRNPLGKGFAPSGEGKEATHPLPNLERPGQLVSSPKQRPEPTSFGPIDFTWPQRFSLLGTYDKKWLETRFPGFAEDLDWRVWNLAESDQQTEKPFRGDEAIVCENLHPTRPRLEGRPLALAARCFVQRQGADALEEVALELTTYWLFPERERIVMVWHGAVPVVEDDAADVAAIMIAGDRPDARRPLSHYEAVFAKRTGDERAYEALNDADLFPEEWCGLGPDVDEQTAATTPERLLEKRQHAAASARVDEARAKIASVGLDPDEHGPGALPPPEDPPGLADVGKILDEKKKEAAAAREQAEQYEIEMTSRVFDFYQSEGMNTEELAEEMEFQLRGPPDFTAEGERAKFRKLADDAEAMGYPVDELEHYATDEEPYALWTMREQNERELYRTQGHLQAPALPLDDDESDTRRRAVTEALKNGESLARWDLTGAKLAGIDLSGADLTDAYLESTDLEGARLDGANLTRAMLAHASLGAASLEKTCLRDANLGGARLRGASLRGADLTDARLDGIDLSAADLSEAILEGVTLQKGAFTGAILAGARLATAKLVEVSLDGVDMSGADLRQALFSRVHLGGLNLSGANLEEATFHASTAKGTNFENAKMRGVRCVEECNFDGASFSRADLTRANFRTISMVGANLSGARVEEADLSGADLTGANLYRAVAKRSLLVRTVLVEAKMISIDLMEAILEKADIRGADLRGANLFGADFALVRSDPKTTVAEAIQDRVRVLPLREAPSDS